MTAADAAKAIKLVPSAELVAAVEADEADPRTEAEAVADATPETKALTAPKAPKAQVERMSAGTVCDTLRATGSKRFTPEQVFAVLQAAVKAGTVRTR